MVGFLIGVEIQVAVSVSVEVDYTAAVDWKAIQIHSTLAKESYKVHRGPMDIPV